MSTILNDMLRNAVQAKASDIHINVGSPPLFRIHTIVQPSDFPIVTPEGAMRIAKEMMNDQRWAEFQEKRDSDFSYEIPGLSRFRSIKNIREVVEREGIRVPEAQRIDFLARNQASFGEWPQLRIVLPNLVRESHCGCVSAG